MLESLLLRERLDADPDHRLSFLPSGVPLIVLLPLLSTDNAGDGWVEKRNAPPFPEDDTGSEGWGRG